MEEQQVKRVIKTGNGKWWNKEEVKSQVVSGSIAAKCKLLEQNRTTNISLNFQQPRFSKLSLRP